LIEEDYYVEMGVIAQTSCFAVRKFFPFQLTTDIYFFKEGYYV